MAEFCNIEDKMKNFKFNSDINILLLGASGVGKSTLINAFANYVTFTDFEEATKYNPMVLIPSQFIMMCKNGSLHEITTGDPNKNEFLQPLEGEHEITTGDAVENEFSQTFECATQDVKTYVFPIFDKSIRIRLIDTPGIIGNKDEELKDNRKTENILRYIANLHKIHAICFLLKPNEVRDMVSFQYYMNKIFSSLNKRACDNIIFCFTHTRGSDYGPGASIKMLEKAISELTSRPPYAKIVVKTRNTFYFDNESFKYLTAVQKCIHFDSNIKERNKESWEKSAQESWRLIKYITGDNKNKPLMPYFVKITNTTNEARRVIIQLVQPLADITILILHNINVLKCHEQVLNANKSLEELKNELYLPVIELETTTLSQPVTFCNKCYKSNNIVRGFHYYRYKQCHDPSCLKQVPEEVIGTEAHCGTMNGTSTCCVCKCDFKDHMRVYYLTKTVEKREIDKSNISDEVELKKSKHQIIENIEKILTMSDGRKRLSGSGYRKEAQKKLEKQREVVEKTAKISNFFKKSNSQDENLKCTPTDDNVTPCGSGRPNYGQTHVKEGDDALNDAEASIKEPERPSSSRSSNEDKVIPYPLDVKIVDDPALWEINDRTRRRSSDNGHCKLETETSKMDQDEDAENPVNKDTSGNKMHRYQHPYYYIDNNFLKKYVESKKLLDNVLEMTKTIGKDAVINAQDVSEAINQLYSLKHNGKKIKELYNCQKNSRTEEFKNIEYIHKVPCKGIKIEAVQETGNRENLSGKEHLNRGYYDSDNSDSD
ncbi:uncharacterized protein LOC126886296 [Diabrotica virgifera virgifera]|uniref:DUF8206 domain-containing protein n=1 Tax=Diabrotica virgifera virgifera TaxID=50390 RepID=A0ABM5KG07_DIAVI|nr:uncharacterized protein LOC126886296 [Diabrotica virgifera virgifera]